MLVDKIIATHVGCEYGEYDNGVLVSPPHPSCPFDGTTFYNDEKLFLHMN